jgi:hypothetical protein
MIDVLCNRDGTDYIVLEGTVGSGAPAILLSMSDPDEARPYIVVAALGEDPWRRGEHHATLSEAYHDWQGCHLGGDA